MIWLLPACVGVAALSILATGLLRAQLRRRAILDEPNERSSHAAPTPRGAGLAVVPIILVAWLAAWLIDENIAAGQTTPLILIGAGVLAVVSWIDDLRHLPEWIRLAVQIAVVVVAVAQFGSDALVFQGLLPGWLDSLAAALAWIWFINLFNFMDGIDGMTGVESSCLGVGLAVLALLAPAAAPSPWLGLSLAATTLGFLVWNWHPARIFMGDVGSVPLGFLLGWLLLSAAANGLWAPALILPLYYLADATLTLCRRALRGGRFWRPHREHFYQWAVQNGRSHARVVLPVLAANIVLIVLAATAVAAPLLSLGGACVVTAALLLWMRS
ncbi:MAG: glycosyltransferase family 4 protein [Alphaproteobacteria bacterium]|nr:glycosyltransferase family 4 protein [Alphaproteobacteria bacterium]